MTPVTRSHVDSTIAALTRERDAISQTIAMLQILSGGEASPAQPAIGPGTVEVHTTSALEEVFGLQMETARAPKKKKQGGRPRKAVAPRARLSQKQRTSVRRASVTPAAPKAVQPARIAGQVGSSDLTDAATRRAELCNLIHKSAVGMTTAELRDKTPRMSAKDRQNALSRLKELKEIRRAGNTWVRVRPGSEDAES